MNRNLKNQISVQYEKYYTDDIGKKINELFSFDQQILGLESLWLNAIDAFYKYDSPVHFTCVNGDFRVVVAEPQNKQPSENSYTFHQYFLTGMDGKIVSVPAGMLFGLQNLSSDITHFIKVSNINSTFERTSFKIFNWYSKR